MNRIRLGVAACGAILLVVTALFTAAPAAEPPSGTISMSAPRVDWTGTLYLRDPLSSGTTCDPAGTRCDQFMLTVVPPPQDFFVNIVVRGPDRTDLDLTVFAGNGVTPIASSETYFGFEGLTLRNPPSALRIVVNPYNALPGDVYKGTATLGLVPGSGSAYRATTVPDNFPRFPVNQPVAGEPLSIVTNEVGRGTFEPTIGVNAQGTAFFATFAADGTNFVQAHTEILRSRDAGQTWESIQPSLPGPLDVSEPPVSLDPYVHVDPDTGRVFSIDSTIACAWLVYTDDEGASWRRNPVACGLPPNDHQSMTSGVPPAGVVTNGYPNVVYVCAIYAAVTCARSLDGGATFLPTIDAAYGNEDYYPDTGEVCAAGPGQPATDPAGRLFLPAAACSLPTVAITDDAGDSWHRVRISKHNRVGHEVSLAVDSAGNVYATWQGTDRLPYLSVSTTRGETWSEPMMIAPPGVLEAIFPTIAAGDPGRIAVTFPGSAGAANEPNRTWNTYVLASNNALQADPLFAWTTANPPSDPIERGYCDIVRCAGGDFMDIQISPVDGTFWATAVDACTGPCVTGGAQRTEGVGIVIQGPSLG